MLFLFSNSVTKTQIVQRKAFVALAFALEVLTDNAGGGIESQADNV
jgi:hypothetical protein